VINAPELSTDAGKAALAFAETLLSVGMRVTTTSFGWDKYGGRYDGAIVLPDGRDFAQVMLDNNQAVPVTY
jgi:endonuclease YncB( thermonuclease family)